MSDDLRQRSPIERHVQSAILGMLMLLMGWVGNTLIAVGKSVAIIETQMGSFSAQLAGTYSAKEAARDIADVTRQMDEVRRRIDTVEKKTERVKDSVEGKQR